LLFFGFSIFFLCSFWLGFFFTLLDVREIDVFLIFFRLWSWWRSLQWWEFLNFRLFNRNCLSIWINFRL
jgi:hypothetical protein